MLKFVKLSTGEELLVTILSTELTDGLIGKELEVKNCIIMMPQQTGQSISINLIPWPMWVSAAPSGKELVIDLNSDMIIAMSDVPISLANKYKELFSKIIMPETAKRIVIDQ
jgi:hypothetical protein